jgi:outer membrane protein
MRLRIGLRAILAALAVCAGSGLVSAQTKIATINLQKAVLESAEIQKASAELTAKYKPRADQIEQLQKDLAGISQQLQNGKLSPQAEADLNALGQRKQRDLQRLQEDLQADVDRERNEILSKSSQKMSEVVKRIAEEKGLDMVVDVTTTIFFKPAMEITADAIAAYNKAYPAK